MSKQGNIPTQLFPLLSTGLHQAPQTVVHYCMYGVKEWDHYCTLHLWHHPERGMKTLIRWYSVWCNTSCELAQEPGMFRNWLACWACIGSGALLPLAFDPWSWSSGCLLAVTGWHCLMEHGCIRLSLAWSWCPLQTSHCKQGWVSTVWRERSMSVVCKHVVVVSLCVCVHPCVCCTRCREHCMEVLSSPSSVSA